MSFCQAVVSDRGALAKSNSPIFGFHNHVLWNSSREELGTLFFNALDAKTDNNSNNNSSNNNSSNNNNK